jgi:hypothetical protein
MTGFFVGVLVGIAMAKLAPMGYEKLRGLLSK